MRVKTIIDLAIIFLLNKKDTTIMKKLIALLIVTAILLTACVNGSRLQQNPKANTSAVSQTGSDSVIKTEPEPVETQPSIISTEDFFQSDYNFDWQNAYAEYFNSNHYSNWYSIYIDDINNDDIPEVVINIDQWGSCDVLYYLNGEINILYLDVQFWGFSAYLDETKQFINLPFYGHTQGTFGNISNYSLYSWTSEGYKQTYVINRESGYENYDTGEKIYGQASINGLEVSNEDFECALVEMDELSKKSIWFPMYSYNDLNGDFNDYLEEKIFYEFATTAKEEKTRDFIEDKKAPIPPECIKVYREYFDNFDFELIKSYVSKKYIYIGDINNDGFPEVVIPFVGVLYYYENEIRTLEFLRFPFFSNHFNESTNQFFISGGSSGQGHQLLMYIEENLFCNM